MISSHQCLRLITKPFTAVGLAEKVRAAGLAIVEALRQPMAVLHGAEERLISLDYLRKLDFPALWPDEVQVIPDEEGSFELTIEQQASAAD